MISFGRLTDSGAVLSAQPAARLADLAGLSSTTIGFPVRLSQGCDRRILPGRALLAGLRWWLKRGVRPGVICSAIVRGWVGGTEVGLRTDEALL